MDDVGWTKLRFVVAEVEFRDRWHNIAGKAGGNSGPGGLVTRAHQT
jgi:hypothetical protein